MIKKSSGLLIKELKAFRNGILLEEITSYNFTFYLEYKIESGVFYSKNSKFYLVIFIHDNW